MENDKLEQEPVQYLKLEFTEMPSRLRQITNMTHGMQANVLFGCSWNTDYYGSWLN